MTLLCHKTSMLIVKYKHQTAERLWHLDWITGAGRGACVRWRCCPGAAAGGRTDRQSIPPTLDTLQPGAARPAPSGPSDAAAAAGAEPPAMPPPVKQVSLPRFAACGWRKGLTSKGSCARTPLDRRLHRIVGAIEHFCIFDGFLSLLRSVQGKKGKYMCFNAWWPAAGCSA